MDSQQTSSNKHIVYKNIPNPTNFSNHKSRSYLN